MHDHSLFATNAASRLLVQARDQLVNSGAQLGQHLQLPFAGGQVAAFRSDGRVRFEVIAADGSFADHTFHGATQAVAGMIDAAVPS